ncbi:MAG: DUF1156 domain-containing protein [Anaerolineaceae bacterium]|nr:DUF1156 domain-containing protein [Anaerolineaceae bacterium]
MTRKKLIEVALPLEAINEASAREKSIRHGHPSTLHLWWARRPLAACRAVIFTSLVDDPDDPEAPPEFVAACRKLPQGKNAAEEDTPRRRLFDFIERLVLWESTTDEKVLATARELIRLATDGNPPPLLDPFAGGGSIPLEAQRLGLESFASDLNPVAVMINKALIEIPPKFANQPPVNPRDRQQLGGDSHWPGATGLAADVRYYGEWMRDKAYERIGHLYPDYNGETVIAWLWARTVRCPNPACGATMPLVSSFELSKKKGRRAWVEPQIDRAAKQVRFTVKTGKGEPPAPPKIGRGAKFRCLVCGETAPDQHLKDEGMAGRMGAQLMAIVTQGQSGRSYYTPTIEQEQIAARAKPEWEPTGELAHDPRNIWCKQYGLVDFADLFTPRQLTALTTFSDLVAEARQQIEQDARVAWREQPPPQPSPGGGGSQNSSPQREEVGRDQDSSPQRGEAGRGALSRTGTAQVSTTQSTQPLWTPTPVPPHLLEAARRLRREMTDAEQLLWQCLRRKQLGGYRFRKQHPLERFVLDFYCPAARLAIELDGGQHNTPDGLARDEERTAILQQHGIEVIRFWNNEVLTDLEGVLQRIYEILQEREQSQTPPIQETPPQPAPARGGSQNSSLQRGETGSHTSPPAGGIEGGLSLRDGGLGPRAYAEAVSVYLAFVVDKSADYWSNICSWHNSGEKIRNTFGRQAIPMVWDYTEANPFSDSTGNWLANVAWIPKVLETNSSTTQGCAEQVNATKIDKPGTITISTDPPYYDNIGYADLSDFFYVWLRPIMREVYPEVFSTFLTPKIY